MNYFIQRQNILLIFLSSIPALGLASTVYKSEFGQLEVVDCPSVEYQCSGVDWLSEGKDPVVFELSFPAGDPPRPFLKDIVVNGSKQDDINLAQKLIACNDKKVPLHWNLKKQDKYFRFSLGSICEKQRRSIDAVCQKLKKICTSATPKK